MSRGQCWRGFAGGLSFCNINPVKVKKRGLSVLGVDLIGGKVRGDQALCLTWRCSALHLLLGVCIVSS